MTASPKSAKCVQCNAPVVGSDLLCPTCLAPRSAGTASSAPAPNVSPPGNMPAPPLPPVTDPSKKRVRFVITLTGAAFLLGCIVGATLYIVAVENQNDAAGGDRANSRARRHLAGGPSVASRGVPKQNPVPTGGQSAVQPGNETNPVDPSGRTNTHPPSNMPSTQANSTDSQMKEVDRRMVQVGLDVAHVYNAARHEHFAWLRQQEASQRANPPQRANVRLNLDPYLRRLEEDAVTIQQDMPYASDNGKAGGQRSLNLIQQAEAELGQYRPERGIGLSNGGIAVEERSDWE